MIHEKIYQKLSDVAPELSIEQKHELTIYFLELVYENRYEIMNPTIPVLLDNK